jgi:hypothetical protein
MTSSRKPYRPLPGAARAFAYIVLFAVIMFPLWIVSLVIQAHYEVVPPMWLGLWPWWGWCLMVIALETRIWRKIHTQRRCIMKR